MDTLVIEKMEKIYFNRKSQYSMEIVDLSVATGSIALYYDGIKRERNHSI